jgi:hypothetical protein
VSEGKIMQNAYIVTGTITDGRTLALDEAVPVRPGGKVRVVVELLPPDPVEAQKALTAFLTDLRERQRQRGHVPPTREEVDAYLREERESWDF